MSARETIGKLEALLARVSSRAAEPRPARAAVHAAPAPAAPAHAPAPAPAAAPVSAARPITVPPPEAIELPDNTEAFELPTRPPPPGVAAPPDVEVELPEPAIELRHEVPAQSDERIAVAKPVEPLEEEIEVAPAAVDVEVEVEESAPVSSKRPLGPPPAEVLEKKAFGADEAPEPVIHAPPPESGKLPAVPELTPIVEAADYDNQDITGVHHTPPGDRRKARADDALAQSGEHHTELVVEATHANVVAKAPVADVVGQANAFKPATFGELLDASLKL